MIVAETVFLAVFWSWVLVALIFLRNTVLPRLPLPSEDVVASLGLPIQAVTFRATDGLRLGGWTISSDPDRPWVIGCHGLGTNRADLLEVAQGLYRAGFNVLLFDFRGHGTAEGRTTSFGWREQRDLEGALIYLSGRPDVLPRPFGVYAISMGAATALMVAARDERIGALVVESPYYDLAGSLKRHLRLMYSWLPGVPADWYIAVTYRLRFGVWPSQVSAAAAAGRLGARPVLIIGDGEDIRMPPEEVSRVAEAVRGPKETWFIQGADHLGGYAEDPERYLKRVTEFFRRSLETNDLLSESGPA